MPVLSQCGGDAGPAAKPALVSICVPVYNHGQYIAQCIQSIVSQDYRNIELIVIDDGSTDNSVEELQKLTSVCEKRFARYELRVRPNKGLSRTLNEGLDWARGEYFCVIASDDAMLPRKTSILISYLESTPGCVGAFGGVSIIDNAGNAVGRVNPSPRACAFEDVFLAKVKLLAPANLLRTTSVRSIGGFNPDVKVEDWDMWLRMTCRGEVLHIVGEVVALYRRHENNTSKNYDLMQCEMAKIAKSYSEHPLYAKNQSMLLCMKFRDKAWVSKWQAIRMLPLVIWRVKDVRMYQGLFNLLLKWRP